MSTSEYVHHSIWLGDQVSRVKFVVIDLKGFDVILGLPWLQQMSPLTDWSTGAIVFSNGNTIRPIMHSSSTDPHALLSFAQMCAWKPDHQFALFVSELPDHTNDDVFKSKEEAHSNQSPEATKFMKELIAEFPEVFPDDLPKALPPKREIEHEIKLRP